MTQVEHRKARTDIYERGIKVPDAKTKSGFRRDRSQPHPDGDKKLVEKGQKYYTWAFRFGPSYISLTPPRRSQLTQSSFLGQLYDLEDRIGEISADSPEDLQSERDDIVSELESLRDETQSSFDNMPEGLQQGDTGQLLEERVNAVEEAISEFEGVELDYDEPDDSELESELEEDFTEDPEEVKAHAEAIERLKQEKLEEWLEEKIGELKEISIEAS